MRDNCEWRQRKRDATPYRFGQEREIPLRLGPVDTGRTDDRDALVAVLRQGPKTRFSGGLRRHSIEAARCQNIVFAEGSPSVVAPAMHKNGTDKCELARGRLPLRCAQGAKSRRY